MFGNFGEVPLQLRICPASGRLWWHHSQFGYCLGWQECERSEDLWWCGTSFDHSDRELLSTWSMAWTDVHSKPASSNVPSPSSIVLPLGGPLSRVTSLLHSTDLWYSMIQLFNRFCPGSPAIWETGDPTGRAGNGARGCWHQGRILDLAQYQREARGIGDLWLEGLPSGLLAVFVQIGFFRSCGRYPGHEAPKPCAATLGKSYLLGAQPGMMVPVDLDVFSATSTNHQPPTTCQSLGRSCPAMARCWCSWTMWSSARSCPNRSRWQSLRNPHRRMLLGPREFWDFLVGNGTENVDLVVRMEAVLLGFVLNWKRGYLNHCQTFTRPILA